VQKITETIEKFVGLSDFKNGIYVDLRFLILTERSWTKVEKKNIQKKYQLNNLKFTEDVQFISLSDLSKQSGNLEPEKIDALLNVFKNEFGEKSKKNIETFDFNLFNHFNKILDEDEVNNIYQGLYNGSSYHCIHFGDQIFMPYTNLAFQLSGKYINKSIQAAHEQFRTSFFELDDFLRANYSSTTNGKEQLIVVGNLSDFEKLIKKENLGLILNRILENMLVSYRNYRKIIKDMFFV
jgi:hypothetical protein